MEQRRSRRVAGAVKWIGKEMRNLLFSLSAAGLIMSAAPALAQTTTTVDAAGTTTTQTTVVKDKASAGAGVGIVGGAVTGAVVGGPVGAVVGAVVGGVAGAAVDPPKRVRTYITTTQVQPVVYDGAIGVGAVLPDTVTVYDIPKYERYRWTYINGQRLLVDRRTHKVVAIINDN
jgi:hypothetical protein